MTWEVTHRHGGGEPRITALTTSSVRLTVHRHIDYPPDIWLMSMAGKIQCSKVGLLATSLEDAQREAIQRARSMLSIVDAELKAFDK